jgi:hypothetical protein
MNKLNEVLEKVLKYWTRNELFDSIQLDHLDFNEFDKQSIKLSSEIEFYLSEGMTFDNTKDDSLLLPLFSLMKNLNRTLDSNKELLKLMISYTKQCLDKENRVPVNIKKRYDQLKSISSSQRTEKEKEELSNLANQILQLTK